MEKKLNQKEPNNETNAAADSVEMKFAPRLSVSHELLIFSFSMTSSRRLLKKGKNRNFPELNIAAVKCQNS